MRTLISAAAALAIAAPAIAQNQREWTLVVAESERYGEYLATERSRGTEGRPIYIFTTDTPRTEDQEAVVTCTSTECLDLWPLVIGGVMVEDEVQRDLLGTTDLLDMQVTLYDGWPIYHYNLDQNPMTDEPQGHGIESYGGQWLLIAPSGEPIPAP